MVANRLLVLALVLLTLGRAALVAEDGNRLAWVDQNNPYYPSRTFPKLVTPQWVGEPGVEAVVVLAIDDMRDPPKYEAYLRPILTRLKAIDGRAPVSIMTCKVDPAAPQLQQWLAEGLSLEVHTVDHPCPLLKDDDFGKARSTYDRCVDLMNEIPGNRPVAYRMPCCDSLNTVSPRFFAEIFDSTTEKGQFLELDSSVFNILTPNDGDVPRELVFDADGRARFRKYVPFKSFVNTIEDYPYPYVINRLCWEFPCVVPSDWSAQHLQKPFNPDTVRDLKAALDVVVHKQGVFNLVFHPHGWIRNDQVVELIDHAVQKHGKKVKFLTFREALTRLNTHLLKGNPLRSKDGQDNGVRIVDVDNDGYQDVTIGNEAARLTRVWKPDTGTFAETEFPTPFIQVDRFGKHHDAGVHFGVTRPDGKATVLVSTQSTRRAWNFDGRDWQVDVPLRELLRVDTDNLLTNVLGKDRGGRLRDIDGDGICELIVSSPTAQGIHRRNPETDKWELLSINLPEGTRIADSRGKDAGLRFVDVDEDGHDDVLFSNEQQYSLHLWESLEMGWSRKVWEGERGKLPAGQELPMIVREGTDNGAWFHSRSLWVQNENTAKLPDLVDRRSYNDLLAPLGFRVPPKSPEAALKSFKLTPGFTIELVAAEPLTMDPVAFDWGLDGKLWIVEMADYPLGINGQPGGRVRYLEDTDGDGQYDKSTLFLDKVPYPNGVKSWDKGVLVSAAPDVFYAEDTDGDGKADKREVLYTGFTEGNQQHRVNGFEWGLDNWLYLANGDSGGKVKSLKTGKEISISGRDVRIRPSDGAIEAVTGQAQFGRHRDAWGHWFGCNNSNPMFQYVLADEYLRRNPHYAGIDPRVNVSEMPGASPVFPISRTLTRFNDFDRANRFTSACSTIVYGDELFGPAFQGNAFTSEPVHNLIHREVVTWNGPRMTSRRAPDEQTSEFLVSSDSWFRPAMIKVGPDGALWIADMYRLVIEHPQWIPLEMQQQLDLRAGHDKGRIWRVVPAGHFVPGEPASMGRSSDLRLPDDYLLRALDRVGTKSWWLDKIQESLVEGYRRDQAVDRTRAAETVQPLRKDLVRLVASEKVTPQVTVHALGILQGLELLRAGDLEAVLQDAHSGVVENAIRVSESLAELSDAEWDALSKCAEHTSASVRLQLACTLGQRKEPRAAAILGQMLLTQRDPYVFAGAMSSLNRDNVDAVLKQVLLQKDRQTANLNFLEILLGQAAAFGSTTAVKTLVAEVTQPQDGKYADWQFRAVASLMTIERRQGPGGESLLSLAPQLGPLLNEARRIAVDTAASASLRAAAIPLLGQNVKDPAADVERLSGLLTPQSEIALQLAAVEALGRIDDETVPASLLKPWSNLTPTLRTRVLDVLLAREAWIDSLLKEIESGSVRPQDVDAVRRQRLLSHAIESVRNRAQKLLAGSSTTDRAKVVQQFKEAETLAGDATRGRQVFQKACSTCHKLGDLGHEVGPDLMALTDKSPASLLAAILDPNRAIEAKFLNYVAATNDGRTFDGLLVSESGNSITIRGPEAKDTVLLRADLEELKGSARSMMPEGLEKDLKAQDLADVIALLRVSDRTIRHKSFKGNTPQLVAPDKDGSLLLTTGTCEIFGPTLILEEKYRNLGYWSSPDDYAAWLIDVPRSGRYALHVTWACQAENAGNVIEFTCSGQSITAVVKSTGTWETYKEEVFGVLPLEKGPQRLVVRPSGPIEHGALLDLKSIRLVLQEGR